MHFHFLRIGKKEKKGTKFKLKKNNTIKTKEREQHLQMIAGKYMLLKTINIGIKHLLYNLKYLKS